MDSNFTKYKYLLGEPTYKSKRFDAIQSPIQQADGNTIAANSRMIAVSQFEHESWVFILLVSVAGRRWRQCGCAQA